MEKLEFDHLVIGVLSLRQGFDWVLEATGIEVPEGGEHPRMGTHNRVTAMAPDTFFEIIAINPSTTIQKEARWFALDHAYQQERLTERLRPIAWVARTTNLDAALERGRKIGVDLGQAIEMTRGDMRWRIAVRSDGSLPEGGTVPILIQWPEGPHPAGAMADLGLRLNQIMLRHPQPNRLKDLLAGLGVDHLVSVSEAPGMMPEISAAMHAPGRDDIKL
jgi:hypothetical protein